MTDRPHLRALADHVGILPAYFDISGAKQVTKDDACVALLSAMGFDVSSEEAAAHAMEKLGSAERASLLPPVHVFMVDEIPLVVSLTLPKGVSGEVGWHVELQEESGESHAASGRVLVEQNAGQMEVPIPENLPTGYHRLRIAMEFPGKVLEAEQSLIVTPDRCTPLAKRLGDHRAFGVWTNLYTLRSGRNMGVGDLTDLKDLVHFTGCHDAAFVGINPLHALYNRHARVSPYSPLSRLGRNILYLDVEAVPEFVACRKAQEHVASEEFQAELKRVRASRHVEYKGVLALKLEILRLLHNVFLKSNVDNSTERGRAYAEYIETQGSSLRIFATFMALQTWLWRTGPWDGTQTTWREWPDAYRTPESPEVQAFCKANKREVDFHCFLQFELDCQLRLVADQARTSGMPIGVYNDLAIGAAADGSDAWAFPDLFVEGVRVGAPPDPYSETGQTWGFPPIDPCRLRATRYVYWTGVLKSAMAHAGMLRIDHVMGLFRQFWVPEGRPATEGAYVAYPAKDLLGILALESQRHGTVIVGEDLGTVPPEVPPTLAKWEILSSQVLYFERNAQGDFLPASSYSNRALVTATTHDHPPLAGYFRSRDLDIRCEIGLLQTPAELERARFKRGTERAALLRRLIAEGLLSGAHDVTEEMFCDAVHRFLTRTPAPLIGISLDDLALETDPVNIPGVKFDQYPSWSRKMTRRVGEICADSAVKKTLQQMCASTTQRGYV